MPPRKKAKPKTAKKTASKAVVDRVPAKKKTAAPVLAKVKKPRSAKKNKRGVLISFEGSEGSGKTSQISRLSTRLEDAGCDVVCTREPGGTDIGEEIRHLLKHASASTKISPEAELLLFAASRAQLVREVIVPSLDKGKIILCDRFLDSTTVYQGVGRQISAEPVHIINTFAVGDIIPDITIVLDIPAETGFDRIRHRTTDLPDRMENETIDFYRKVREGYLLLAKALPERFIVVDGSRSRKWIEDKLWDELKQRIG